MTRLLQSYPRLTAFAGLCAVPAITTGLDPWAIGAGVAVHALTTAHGVADVRSSLLVPTRWQGDRRRPVVALTFDDGPHPSSTPAILATLARHRAHATFFMIGRWAAKHPALAHAVRAAGHEIGNHTQTHPRTLNLRTGSVIRREIEFGERTLHEVLGAQTTNVTNATPLRFRPPVGLRSPMLMTALRSFPRSVVTWSIHSHDRHAASPGAIAERVLRRIGPGDIVVLHDGNDRDGPAPPHTPAAVDAILEGVRARNLTAVTLGAILK